MRATRRRRRTIDPFASPDAGHLVCQILRERLPEVIPKPEKELPRFLYAVRHVERLPTINTRRGRPCHRARENLIKAARQLRPILERETGGRVSLSSFIARYLPLLHFPIGVAEALASSTINLQEATLLARVTVELLGCSPAKTKSIRNEALRPHIIAQSSQNGLRDWVKEIPGEASTVSSENMTAVVQKVDELLEIDTADKRHIFYEEINRLFYAMCKIEPEDIDEEMLERFMADDELSGVIYSIKMKQRQHTRTSQKFTV